MPESGIDMYRNGFCQFLIETGGFDAKRNPIPSKPVPTEKFECFLDQNLPNETIYSPDGQLVKDASGVIYLDKDTLKDNNLELKVGYTVTVFDKETDAVMLKGSVKSFKEDLFHTRIWV